MSKAFPIKDFPNYYITDTGDVYSRSYRNTGRIKKLKPSLTKHGYLQVCLYYGDKSKRFRIHQLVAETFLLNPENKPCINHKDGNKINNHASNLEWTNMSENTKHAYLNRLAKNAKGEEDSQSNPIDVYNAENNCVYGVSLRDIVYKGKEPKKLLSMIFKNTRVINAKDDIPFEVRTAFIGNNYVIPCLYY